MATNSLLMLLLFSMAAHSSATWCICKDGVGDAAMQKALDYACGAGADCNPTKQNGVCFNPNTVKAHCNYAVNSYFQKKGQAVGSCDFSGAAAVSTTDPSIAGCVYPSSASGGGTTTTTPTTPTSGSTTTATPTTTGGRPTINSPTGTGTGTGTGTSPLVTTPSNGVLGGINNGLGPSGTNYNPDGSDGAISLRPLPFLITFLISGLVLLPA